MNKTYHFLSGLPRSGNTLLSAILNQNPDIYSSPLSPLTALFWASENHLNNLESTNRNVENKNRTEKLLSLFISNFYADVKKPIIIDRDKTWGTPGNLDIIKKYITPAPKIIFTVRDILEILASFIKMKATYLINDTTDSNSYINNYYSAEDAIAEHLMGTNGDIDKCLLSLSSAFYPENKGIFHIVEYNDLVLRPEETMSGIYKFLELPDYRHDFKNIQKVESDKDILLGFPRNMHDVREHLSKSSTSVDILSDYIKHKYSNMEFWKEDSLLKVQKTFLEN